MRRVLVLAPAEDRGEVAIGLVANLAQRTDLEVHVLRVLEESMHAPGGGDASDEATRIRDLLAESEAHALEDVAAPLRRHCAAVTTHVHWGVAWEAVLDLVERFDVDLVVKPARGLSHESRVFFGATALQLFRKSPRPVWVVGDDGSLPRRILAAIDPGLGEARGKVARRILEWGRWMAGLTGAELHVACCWYAPAADLLKGALPPEDVEAYVEDARARARAGLARVLDGASPPLPDEAIHVVEGDPRVLLSDFAEAQGFDVVVMGSQGKSEQAGDLLGETAELVVRAVRSSVMTVSPQSPPPEA